MAASTVFGSLGGYSAEFLAPEQQERFTFVKTKVCGNKAVDIADLEKNGMHCVIKAMNRMQWMGITTLSEVSYPDLVKAFYVCLRTEEDRSLISSVKGTQIKIDHELLHSLFGVKTSGHSGVHTVDAQVKGLGIVGPGFKLKDGKLDINQLNAFNRLLHFIVCQILVPRSATFSTCTKADSDIMFWAIQNKDINMAAVMIERMRFARDQIWDTKSKLNVSLPYAHLLTKVFKHFGIDLTGAVVEKMGQSIRSRNLRKSGFSVINGVWSKTSVAEGEAIIVDVQEEAAEQLAADQAVAEPRIEKVVPAVPVESVAAESRAAEQAGSSPLVIESHPPETPIREAVVGAADTLSTSIVTSILREVVDSVLTTPVTSETGGITEEEETVASGHIEESLAIPVQEEQSDAPDNIILEEDAPIQGEQEPMEEDVPTQGKEHDSPPVFDLRDGETSSSSDSDDDQPPPASEAR
ncbi:hypothetical protein Taro_023013 [Colocasia esculenta]|uniref:Putative plant transposon protein domain-containing protein n=1 Tax=Colocasia esculenta TaxID=4460 RepID=A0A843V9L8_COLES|nr:hypothetical protein [Colocasia esculenta]